MSTLACAQCGRSTPSDPTELARWKYGDLAASGEIDETAAGMLLCPDCAEGDRLGESSRTTFSTYVKVTHLLALAETEKVPPAD